MPRINRDFNPVGSMQSEGINRDDSARCERHTPPPAPPPSPTPTPHTPPRAFLRKDGITEYIISPQSTVFA